MFEELLNAYLARVLLYASALQGARLTFAQKLALARAISTHLEPDHWTWKAIGDLNRIRNSLSHEAAPRDLADRTDAYVELVVTRSGVPLPPPAHRLEPPAAGIARLTHFYTEADMATISLYYTIGELLEFQRAPSGEEAK